MQVIPSLDWQFMTGSWDRVGWPGTTAGFRQAVVVVVWSRIGCSGCDCRPTPETQRSLDAQQQAPLPPNRAHVERVSQCFDLFRQITFWFMMLENMSCESTFHRCHQDRVSCQRAGIEGGADILPDYQTTDTGGVLVEVYCVLVTTWLGQGKRMSEREREGEGERGERETLFKLLVYPAQYALVWCLQYHNAY